MQNLRKESSNSGGQQFHKYQQNKQSPLTSNHGTNRPHAIRRWKSRFLKASSQTIACKGVRVIVINATFYNISVLSWR